jgi:hypothetical protein
VAQISERSKSPLRDTVPKAHDAVTFMTGPLHPTDAIGVNDLLRVHGEGLREIAQMLDGMSGWDAPFST